MSGKQLIRRKHSSVDLQQTVIRLDEYERPLSSQGGASGAVLGLGHEACVATTENGKLYLIETDVEQQCDIDFKNGHYREGACRIAQVTRQDIRNWQLLHSVTQVTPGLTLEDLFDACGTEHDPLLNNCWNSTQRMRVRANESEDGLTWQGKAAIGVGAVGLLAVGLGALAAALSGDKKGNKTQKH